MLGFAMTAFHDHGISPGALGVPGLDDSGRALDFRLTREPLTIDQLSNTWEAVHARLRVPYCVRTLQIGSDLAATDRRVMTRWVGIEDKGPS